MGRWEKDRIIDEEDKKKMMMGWKRFLCLDNQKIYYHRCCYVHGLDTFSDAAAITLARLGDAQSRVHLAPISSITSGNVDVIDSRARGNRGGCQRVASSVIFHLRPHLHSLLYCLYVQYAVYPLSMRPDNVIFLGGTTR